MLLAFVQNVALLLSLSLLQGFVARHWRAGEWIGRLVTGLLFGGIAMIAMALPLRFADGVIFDARTVALSIVALYYGWFPGLLAGVLAAGYRFLLGGVVVWIGIGTIATAVLIGLGARWWWRAASRHVPARLLAFGMVTHALCLLWFHAFPPAVRAAFFAEAALAYFALLSLATLFIGLLLNDIHDRLATETRLTVSERRLRRLFDNAEVSIWDEDFSAALARLTALRHAGVTDLRQYLRDRPEELAALAGLPGTLVLAPLGIAFGIYLYWRLRAIRVENSRKPGARSSFLATWWWMCPGTWFWPGASAWT